MRTSSGHPWVTAEARLLLLATALQNKVPNLQNSTAGELLLSGVSEVHGSLLLARTLQRVITSFADFSISSPLAPGGKRDLLQLRSTLFFLRQGLTLNTSLLFFPCLHLAAIGLQTAFNTPNPYMVSSIRTQILRLGQQTIYPLSCPSNLSQFFDVALPLNYDFWA